MSVKEYPRLDERVSRRTLENGLEVIVVHKPRHAKQYAFSPPATAGWICASRGGPVAGHSRGHCPLPGAQDV